MTHGSLFSGIGGFDLAAAWAGWTNVFNCEIDPFCRRVSIIFPNRNNMKTYEQQTLPFGATASTCSPAVSRASRSASRANARVRPTLALAARMGLLSTPTANDAINSSLPPSQAKRKSGVVHDVMISHPSRIGKGSRLNPRYVAQMMGFPPDWTELPFRHGAASRSKLTATR